MSPDTHPHIDDRNALLENWERMPISDLPGSKPVEPKPAVKPVPTTEPAPDLSSTKS